MGNHGASFHPTWLPCVSGWYGEPGARCLVFTLLTYLWPLIFEGLSCVSILPSGAIIACTVNQTPLPDTYLLAQPTLSHLALEVDRGLRSGLKLPIHQLTPSWRLFWEAISALHKVPEPQPQLFGVLYVLFRKWLHSLTHSSNIYSGKTDGSGGFSC